MIIELTDRKGRAMIESGEVVALVDDGENRRLVYLKGGGALYTTLTLDDLANRLGWALQAQKTNPWGFLVMEDGEGGTRFGVVRMDYWQQHRALDDRDLGNEVQMPERFTEVEESTFEFEGHTADGIKVLQEAGFVMLGTF